MTARPGMFLWYNVYIMDKKIQVFIGQKVGFLTVIAKNDVKFKRSFWICKCVCGKTVKRRNDRFKEGLQSISCGCKHKEWLKTRSLTHGASINRKVTSEYRAYQNAEQRCTKSSNPGYPYYGGRGIEFRFDSFEDFIKEIGLKPSPKCSLDRIDTNGHYEKGNIRWASNAIEQQNNIRRNVFLTFNGETKTIPEWARCCGITKNTIFSRIKRGWCVNCALTLLPIDKKHCLHIENK